MKKLIAVAALATLTGCSIGWVRPGGTPYEFDHDRFDCQQQAAQMYPPMMMQRQVGGGYITPSHTQCYGYAPNISCTTYPGVFVPPQWALEDANEDNRTGQYNACLRSRGYEFHMGFK